MNTRLQAQGQALDLLLASIEALAKCEPWVHPEDSETLGECWCCEEWRGHLEGCEWREFEKAFAAWKKSS